MLIRNPIIRLVKKEDVKQLIILCKEHAVYENATYDLCKKEALLTEHLFSKNKSIRCLVIEQDGTLIGYSTILKQFSTWDADFYLYMDCLYLKEEVRGIGLGKKMMQEIRSLAINEQCNLQWQTPLFNRSAIDFYEAIGSTHLTKERFFWDVKSKMK